MHCDRAWLFSHLIRKSEHRSSGLFKSLKTSLQAFFHSEWNILRLICGVYWEIAKGFFVVIASFFDVSKVFYHNRFKSPFLCYQKNFIVDKKLYFFAGRIRTQNSTELLLVGLYKVNKAFRFIITLHHITKFCVWTVIVVHDRGGMSKLKQALFVFPQLK